MKRIPLILSAAAAASIFAGCAGGGSPTTSALPQAGGLPQSSALSSAVDDRSQWVPRFATMSTANLDTSMVKTPSSSIPVYSSSIKSPLDGRTYNYTIVGANPATSKTTTKITYVPIVLRVHFADGTVLDPTKPGCSDTVSVSDRFYKGPNFVPTAITSNGIAVGTTQVTDAFQRAEFWKLVKGTAYHTVLTAAGAVKVVDVNAPSGSTTVAGVCSGKSHRIGEIDINAYDNIIHGLAVKDATVTQVPVVLTYNVFQTSGGCCILGYHNAFNRGTGIQVYAVGAYNDPGIFSVPIEDIHAWTHELGELFNDPFINNAVPAWGHVGQVGGCQNNLEVGDPLTGTPFILTVGGFTYHPQELAFFDWFFRTPAQGTGAEYSFDGAFETAQGACH